MLFYNKMRSDLTWLIPGDLKKKLIKIFIFFAIFSENGLFLLVYIVFQKYCLSSLKVLFRISLATSKILWRFKFFNINIRNMFRSTWLKWGFRQSYFKETKCFNRIFRNKISNILLSIYARCRGIKTSSSG